MRALVIPVGEDWYAVELTAIRVVLEPLRITPVPDAGAVVLGVVNVRGNVVVVLDAGRLLGGAPIGREPGAIVVAETSRGRVGLAASALPFVETLGEDLGESTLPGTTRRRRATVGAATVLDLEAALAPERLA